MACCAVLCCVVRSSEYAFQFAGRAIAALPPPSAAALRVALCVRSFVSLSNIALLFAAAALFAAPLRCSFAPPDIDSTRFRSARTRARRAQLEARETKSAKREARFECEANADRQ